MDCKAKFELPKVPQGLERPYVLVNCAMSADGKLALPDGRQTRISSEEDMALVHELRNWADAVFVGITTVLKDDPKLTVKEKYVNEPRQPVRIVVDSCCRTPAGSEILNDTAPTIIASTDDHWPPADCGENVELLECGSDTQVDLDILMDELWKRGIRRVMVEGGGTLIASFLRKGLVDELMIFVGDMVIGGRKSPTPVMGIGATDLQGIIRMERYAVIPLEGGVRLHYRVQD